MALTDFLIQIADSIRSKDGTTEPIVATDFPQRILDIPSGGGGDLPFDITAGSFTLSEDYNIYTAEDGSVDNKYSIEHGLSKTPDMFFMWNTKTDVTILLGTIVYAYRFPYVRKFNTYPATNSNMERVSSSGGATATTGSVELNNTQVILSCDKPSWAYLRAGHTYRWFALSMKEVSEHLSSITATKTKTEYTVNDTLNIDDITVTANYSDGSSSVVSGWTSNVSDVDMASEGTKTLTISYTENEITKTASINITISAATPEPEPSPVVSQTGTWQLKTTTGKKYIILGTDDDNYGNTKFFRLLRTYGFPYTMNVEAENILKNMGSDVDTEIFTDNDAPALFSENIDVFTLGKYLHDNNLGEVSQHGDSGNGNCLWNSNRLTGDFLTNLHTTYTEAGGTKTEEELKAAIMEKLSYSDCAQDAPYVANSRAALEEAYGFPICTSGAWGDSYSLTIDNIELDISTIRRPSDYDWRGHNYLSAATIIGNFNDNTSSYDISRLSGNPENLERYVEIINKIQADKVCEFYWHMPFNDQPDISKWRALFDYIKGLVDEGRAEVVTRRQYAEFGEYVENPITKITISRDNIIIGSTDTDEAYNVTVVFEDGTTSVANSDVIIDRSLVNTETIGSYTVYAYYRGFKTSHNVSVISSYTVPQELKNTEYWFVYRNNTSGNWYCGNITSSFVTAQKNWKNLLEFEATTGTINGWKSIDNGTTWGQVTTNVSTHQYIQTNDTRGFDFNSEAGDSIDFIETSGNFEITYGV